MTIQNTILPPAQKWTLPAHFQVTSSKTSVFSSIRAKLAPLSDAARESSIPNTIAKITKNISQYVATLESSLPAKSVVSNCSTVGDFVKVFSITKGVDDILSNAAKKNETGLNLHQRNLGIASGFFQTIISGMAGVKLLDTFKAISLAQISETLGTTTVLPFSVVANGIEIIKNAIDIASKSIKIHKTNLRDNKAKAKMENFGTNVDSTKINAFLENHMQEMKDKQTEAFKKLNEQTELHQTAETAANALEEYEKILDEQEALKEDLNTPKVQKFVNGIFLAFKEMKQKSALSAAAEAHDKAFESHTKTNAKYIGRIQKFESWTTLHAHFMKNDEKLVVDDKGNVTNDDPLNNLIKEKTTRWNTIRENCKIENIKDGLGLAISIAATIGLIATIVLTFSGVGTIPVLLTMTTLWLILALAGLGSALYAKYTKPIDVPVVNLTKFAANNV